MAIITNDHSLKLAPWIVPLGWKQLRERSKTEDKPLPSLQVRTSRSKGTQIVGKENGCKICALGWQPIFNSLSWFDRPPNKSGDKGGIASHCPRYHSKNNHFEPKWTLFGCQLRPYNPSASPTLCDCWSGDKGLLETTSSSQKIHTLKRIDLLTNIGQSYFLQSSFIY